MSSKVEGHAEAAALQHLLDNETPQDIRAAKRSWLDSRIATFALSILASLVAASLLLIPTLFVDLESFKAIPLHIDKMATSLASIEKSYSAIDQRMGEVEKTHRNVYYGVDGDITVGVLFSKSATQLAIDEAVLVIRDKSSLYQSTKIDGEPDLRALRGKYLLLKGNEKGVQTMLKLFVSKVSSKKADINKNVDLFISNETAELLVNDPKVGKLNLKFKVMDAAR